MGLVGILADSVVCSPDRVIPKPGSGYCVDSVSLHIFPHLDDLLAMFVYYESRIASELLNMFSPSVHQKPYSTFVLRIAHIDRLDTMAESRCCRGYLF
jgi:hypothetical protein